MSGGTIPYRQQNPQPPIAGDLKLGGRSKFTIGRSADNDLPVPYPTVSQHHAQIIWNEAARLYLIEDLRSSNGTFVNGKRVIRPAILRKGDTIQIGPMQLIYKPEGIHTKDQANNIGITASNLKQVVSKGKNLLQNINLAIQPREFVAIVGASGSGKSTLLNALSGFKPASDGNVYINGNDLYPNYDSYRSLIGYVPQSNIIHMELTVHEALSYSARLRLPPDMTEAEREKRIDAVLRLLGIQHCKYTPVHKLSGGEQKRVSMGAEYLTQPGIFFLDEATSGLDPGTETEIMTLLRGLADKGQTVLIVTHATKNIAKCHKILFLAKGYLIYYGSPKDALSYFNVNDFDEIYPAVAKIQPAAAAEKYLKSQDYRKYIEPYIRSSSSTYGARSTSNQRGANTNRASFIRQFVIFSQRNFNILKRDNKNLALMLLIAPIIGLMYFLFWRWGLFDATTGNARFALTNLFMAAMVCCLVGALSSMREIVKEAEIYKRERMVFLKIVPYVLSKVWMATLVALYSAFVFIVFMWLAGGWPPADKAVDVYITMVLAIMGGALMGLLISAVSENQNITPLLLVLILVPQLLFGGIIPSSQVGKPGQILGYLTTTKWTFDSLVKISGMGDDIVSNPNWANNVFTSSDFPGIQKYHVKEIDMPEPKQPTFEEKKFAKPGDPPEPPYLPKSEFVGGSWQAQVQRWTDKDMKAWQDNVTKYQDDMEKYKSEFTDYRDNKITNWQKEYTQWKENRSIAIGKAEGTIKAIYDDYGDAFRSNVITNWSVLSSMIILFFGLVLFALRRRDRI